MGEPISLVEVTANGNVNPVLEKCLINLTNHNNNMKTIFVTNRWHIYWQKTGCTTNGNGWMRWSLVFHKVCGNGDDGTRTVTMMSAPTKTDKQ